MGDLTSARLAAGDPPFTRTAVDYCGPFIVVQSRGREKKTWVVLFTCLTTRAVYVDLASSMAADTFLLCLRRFMSFYKPQRMYSDNGTNFVGAERILRGELDRLLTNPQLEAFVRREAIHWIFQPAETPHFGGAHESLVRSVKKALYAAIEQEASKARHPTEDILRTLLFEVAGLLNARPLTYPSSDPDDYRLLTPNDFLNRSSVMDHLSYGDFSDALPREQFRYVQRMRRLFWDLWRSTYLQSLAARQKWRTRQRNLEIGDLVIELDKGLAPGKWKTGRVAATYPGTDGLVRAVDVEIEGKLFRCGLPKLCLLAPVFSPAASSASAGSGEDVLAKAIVVSKK